MGCLVVLEWLFRNFEPVPHGENTPSLVILTLSGAKGKDLLQRREGPAVDSRPRMRPWDGSRLTRKRNETYHQDLAQMLFARLPGGCRALPGRSSSDG